MTRPVILAIMGPSASGKDSLARSLVAALQRKRLNGYITNSSHLIVSDTTRPMRPNEHDGLDYHFISNRSFDKKNADKEYVETYVYGPRRWKYGTPRGEFNSEINVGVFSPSGLIGINYHLSLAYNIIPVLLASPKVKRLWRSIKRDRGLKIEHLRRLRQDDVDFAVIDDLVKCNDYYIDLRRSKLSVDCLTKTLYNILCDKEIIHTT